MTIRDWPQKIGTCKRPNNHDEGEAFFFLQCAVEPTQVHLGYCLTVKIRIYDGCGRSKSDDLVPNVLWDRLGCESGHLLISTQESNFTRFVEVGRGAVAVFLLSGSR